MHAVLLKITVTALIKSLFSKCYGSLFIRGFSDLLMFFAITFVGDFTFIGFPAFYIVWIGLIAYRLLTGLEIVRSELFVQLVVLLLFLPYFILVFRSLSYYDNHLLFTILYVNAFPLVTRLLERTSHNVPWIFLVCMALIGIQNLYLGSDRAFVVFGPNILYRIYCVAFILGFYINLSKGSHGLLPILVLLFLLMAIVSTGSRGGSLVFLACAGLVMFGQRYHFSRLALGVFFVGIGNVIYLYWGSISPFVWRLIYFDPNNTSEAGRLFYYSQAFKFFEERSVVNLFFGLGSENWIFPFHPHSLVLESLVSNGIYFMLVVGLASIRCLYIFLSSGPQRKIILCFLPIIIGSFLSGSALDNFTVISLVFYVTLTSRHTQNLNISSNRIQT